MRAATTAYEPERLFGGLMPARNERGDVDAALAEAEVRIDVSYRMAANHHNAMEAPSTTAVWDGDRLTLYDSAMGVRAVQSNGCCVAWDSVVEDPRDRAVHRRELRVKGDGVAAYDARRDGRASRRPTRQASPDETADVHLDRPARGTGATARARRYA